MNKIIAIVGMCGSGKSVACEYLENIGYKKVYFGGVTMDKLKEEGIEITPDNEKMMREKIRKEYGMAAFAILSLPKIEKFSKDYNVVLDGLYSWEEFLILKEKFPNLILISLITNKNLRYDRLSKREIRPFKKDDAIKRDLSEIENINKAGPIAYADYFILNNGSIDNIANEIDNILGEVNND